MGGNDSLNRPERIGPYRILDTLGEGGMAVVYLAEQAEPVKRRVALKILKSGMDTKQVLARFESERQALAVLDHPNIAKIFDGGVTEFGRPYFAMERVQGVPITDYCDHHRLSTEERVALFIDVCSAVQHAHHKGLIHRDLKPSNLLVGVVDGRPQAKIIDFGIAKAATSSLTEKTLLTRIGQVIGTAQYMSPEQADTSGLDVDTRTDIYSLGVVLYELLVGIVPLDLTAIGDDAMRIALREKDPQKPSTRVSELGDTQDEIAKARRTDPVSLRRELKGDLDWIVMQSIAKDRTHRYETANALAMDCKRFLNHEPVLARPPSAAYLLQRFVRRNRLMVTAATIALAAIIAGATAATLGFLRATEAEQVARQESATAEQVIDYLIGLFEVSDPGEARGNTITAREILDRGAENIASDLEDEPIVQARLTLTLGNVYQELGLFEPAQKLYLRALELREKELGGNDPRVAEAVEALGHVNGELGNNEQAVQLLRRALQIKTDVYGADDPRTVKTRVGLANPLGQMARFEEARDILETAVEQQAATMPATDMARHAAIRQLASVYRRLGRFDDAETYYREALQLREINLPADHPDIGRSLQSLGMVLVAKEQIDDARELFERALSIKLNALGETHPDVANTVMSLAVTYLNVEDFENGREQLLRALDIYKTSLGEKNTRVAFVLSNLGTVSIELGNYEEAEDYLLEAVEIGENELGLDHPTYAFMLRELGVTYAAQGRMEESLRTLQQALAIQERKLPADHPHLVATREFIEQNFAGPSL